MRRLSLVNGHSSTETPARRRTYFGVGALGLLAVPSQPTPSIVSNLYPELSYKGLQISPTTTPVSFVHATGLAIIVMLNSSIIVLLLVWHTRSMIVSVLLNSLYEYE